MGRGGDLGVEAVGLLVRVFVVGFLNEVMWSMLSNYVVRKHESHVLGSSGEFRLEIS